MESVVADLLLGESHTIRELRRVIAKLAPRDLPVLIEGESGVGKELVARALHDASGRRGALVSFNVCAIPESMFEASLFGHVRGAFSGAVRDSDGLLTQGHLGTVFLDEIGGLVSTVQPKLLRALEAGVYRPVGARHDQRSEFRVVAATNENISELITLGGFRADLAYRLRGCVLKVPALRDRPDDIPVLARHFLRENARRFGDSTSLSNPALRLVQEYSWPGNVRELKSVLECAAMIGSGVIDAQVVREVLAQQAGDRPSHVELQIDRAFPDERLDLQHALEAAGWDTDRLARERGVSRATIYRHMARLGITPRARQILPQCVSPASIKVFTAPAWSQVEPPQEASA